MTDEQVAALMQNWRDALAKQMDEMKLRQWCVEQVIKMGKTDHMIVVEANYIFQFIAQPFAETFKDAKKS